MFTHQPLVASVAFVSAAVSRRVGRVVSGRVDPGRVAVVVPVSGRIRAD